MAYNFGTTCLTQVKFSAECTSPNEYFKFNQIENWKCHMFDFRLISLDRITKVVSQYVLEMQLIIIS